MDISEKTGASTDHIEKLEEYILHNRNEIVQKLRLLAKDRCVITGYFNHGNEFIITAVIDVLKDRNVLVLDYGANEALNEKLINADRIVFKTQHKGINAQFSTDKIVRAKFQGQTFLACDIPSEMLWVQRREAYRVRIPLSDEAICQIKLESGDLLEMPVLDISSGGIALMDENLQFEFEPGDTLSACHLFLPDDIRGAVELEICNQIVIKQGNKTGQRFGSKFLNISPNLMTFIQRYINAVDSIRRRTESD